MTDTPIARPLPFAFAFATAALLAACGGGGGGTSAPPSNSGGGQNCMNGPYGTTCTPTGSTFGGAGGGNYVANALVSDNTATQALHHDTHLVNAWGLAFNPQGFSWIANAGTGTSTLYDGTGVAQSLVVTLNQGSPAGIVFNGTTDFSIHSGVRSASSTIRPPPASTTGRALRRCSPLPMGRGTKTAGRPTADSSATVTAPERQSARSAAA